MRRIIKGVGTSKTRSGISKENSPLFLQSIHEKQGILHPDLVSFLLLFEVAHHGLGKTHSQSSKYSFTAEEFQAHSALLTHSAATKDLED